MAAYLSQVIRFSAALPRKLLVFLSLVAPDPGVAQGLPVFEPLNPVASSRSGLYFHPFRDPVPGRWTSAVALDYANLIEYNRLDRGDYVLDSEVLRLSLGVARELGPRTFLELSARVHGAYAGFLDGFLDWYHGALGIRINEREERPQDSFLYSITLPDGRRLDRRRSDLFLGDVGLGVGFRHNRSLQSVLSLTLPTSTGPDGYGRGVPSLALLNTLRTSVNPRMVYEGSVGIGVTPAHGAMEGLQRTTFLAVSSGLRHRVWGTQFLYANLFYHSPYYHQTSLPALDRRELSLDFGWILTTQGGGEWRMGLTEDLEPGGPGIDLVFRMGRTF